MFKSRSQILKKPRLPAEGLFCGYSHRICMQNRIEGFDYCAKHILEDKNSPYKQCNYMSNKNGKRCQNAAPKSDRKDGFCPEHARRAAFYRQKGNRRQKPTETPETLLEEIEHHNNHSGGGDSKDAKKPRLSVEGVANRILDYASSSDSDAEVPLVDQAWRGDVDSDAESIDSEQEDPLKHAGVYTAEEVALITRDKLIRLQSLYIDQFKRLQHVLKEKRRKYIHGRKLESETLASIHAARDDPEQRDRYDRLMAMKRYHKRHGTEALLHRQSKERRISVSEGINYKPPSYPKCLHTESGIKCGTRTVPLSKFCMKHIFDDTHQVLFQRCNFGNGSCTVPVPALAEDQRCFLHSELHICENRLQGEKELKENEQEQEDSKEIQIDVVSEDKTPTFKEPLVQFPLHSTQEKGANEQVNLLSGSSANENENREENSSVLDEVKDSKPESQSNENNAPQSSDISDVDKTVQNQQSEENLNDSDEIPLAQLVKNVKEDQAKSSQDKDV